MAQSKRQPSAYCSSDDSVTNRAPWVVTTPAHANLVEGRDEPSPFEVAQAAARQQRQGAAESD